MCYEPKTSAASPAPATRTTKEWFDTLPSPYREQALQNEPYARWYRQHRHLAAALAYGFSWASSPEGFDYWRAIQDRADKGEFNPPAPEPPADPVCPLPVPNGFSHWEYRGKGYSSERRPGLFAWVNSQNQPTLGTGFHVSGMHPLNDYWEAIPASPATPKVVGYRLLGPDEVVRRGDEYWSFSQGAWELSNNIGQPACAFNAPYRRPITSYGDAPAAL